jgi:glycogen synthase
LQAKLGLDISSDQHVLFGGVTRIVKQKGLNIFMTPIAENGPWLIEAILALYDEATGARVQIPLLGTANDPMGTLSAKLLNQVSQRPQYEGQFALIERLILI